MHSHQRMSQYIRTPNQMLGGRDADQKITEQQAASAGAINFLRGGKTYGGETIINRIRMFTYRIGLGEGFGIGIAVVLFIAICFIAYKRYSTGSFKFITGSSNIHQSPKLEFF